MTRRTAPFQAAPPADAPRADIELTHAAICREIARLTALLHRTSDPADRSWLDRRLGELRKIEEAAR